MDELKTLYDEWHKNEHNLSNFIDIQLSNWHKEALKLSGDVLRAKILEVGCGQGDFSMYLSNKGADITGCDFSGFAIDIAREKTALKKSAANFLVADAQNLPFENNSFDIVFSCECLEHVNDPRKTLKELHRVLKPGGKLVLTTENYSNGMIISWLKTWITGKPFNSGNEIQPNENFFVYWRVKKMMRQSGFIVKKITGWHYVFLILPRNKNLIIENIQNRRLQKILKPFARHMSFLLYK
jgi:ubiquinone biosynthesis O-methyltransferase